MKGWRTFHSVWRTCIGKPYYCNYQTDSVWNMERFCNWTFRQLL